MEFSLLMTDIPVYVFCKFEMSIIKYALHVVISKNVRIAFLYILSIYKMNLGVSKDRELNQSDP